MKYNRLVKYVCLFNFVSICSCIFTMECSNCTAEEEIVDKEDTSSETTESATLSKFPIIINTWWFIEAGRSAWDVVSKGGSALDAVEAGCSKCEELQCDGTVGYGGSPDETGETTLDAMIMDGQTYDIGAVASLRRVKDAISVARQVMERTSHTLLAGDQATKFAAMMGFKIEQLSTPESTLKYMNWKANNCQPNFWTNVYPNPKQNCGPYSRLPDFMGMAETGEEGNAEHSSSGDHSEEVESEGSATYGAENHDTIGMIAIDEAGRMAGGTSTNGAIHKIPGRVGDSPIPGSGAYVDGEVGGAAATGDGDVMMRFLPSLVAVEHLRQGYSPNDSSKMSLQRIVRFYPGFSGAVIAVDVNGNYGAACHNLETESFTFTVGDKEKGVRLERVECF